MITHLCVAMWWLFGTLGHYPEERILHSHTHTHTRARARHQVSALIHLSLANGHTDQCVHYLWLCVFYKAVKMQ